MSDVNADPTVEKIAEALYKSCHSEWRGYIPRSIELKYRRMAEAAINAIGFASGPQIETRLVGPWVRGGES